jgi:hypothetical protein
MSMKKRLFFGIVGTILIVIAIIGMVKGKANYNASQGALGVIEQYQSSHM